MNLLTQDLPVKIDVDGEIINIDYDYKNCVQIILAWEDKGLTAHEKMIITVDRLYETVPKNIEVALKKAMLFLNVGEEQDELENELKTPKPRVYSFEKDSKYLFSAIDQVLNGKLSEGKPVHWWVFSLAFMEIPESCLMSRIIYLRTQKNKGKLSKEEKAQWKEMRELLEMEVPEEALIDEKGKENVNNFFELMKQAKRK